MRKFVLISLFFLSSIGLVSAAVKVALVFDAGGKFDRSFNQSAWEGALKAKNDLGIVLKDVEPADESAVKEAIRTFASQGFDLILGIGFANAPAIKESAANFPDTTFAIVDSVVDAPNVASLVFKEHEGSFLVGMLASMRSRVVNGKRVIGFIGGMDIPLINKFRAGYVQGAKLIYPDIKILINYVGNTPTAWNDPATGKEIAKSQINQGASVIYAAAGGSGNGLFDALKDENGENPCLPKKGHKCVYGVGVDSNQNHIIPGQILTSMLKRVDVAVYETINQANQGKFEAGLKIFGLKEDGVGYALDEHNQSLINPKMKQILNQYRQNIIDGKIVVQSEK